MIAFAGLLERLAFATDPDARIALLRWYLQTQPDPERGFALGVLTGALRLPSLHPSILRGLVNERCDASLFQWSHEFVGDLTETVALIWKPSRTNAPPPSLSEVARTPRAALPDVIAGWLDACEPSVRVALLKLLTGRSRSLVAGAVVRAAVAALGDVPVGMIEEIWHGLTPPYAALFAWLDGTGPRPALRGFQPFMLAWEGEAGDWPAEQLWRGDRIQIANGSVFSRHAEDVSAAYPQWHIDNVVLDGVVTDEPLCLRVFDLLFEGTEDLRALGFTVRRARLEAWFDRTRPPGAALSELVPIAEAGVVLKHPDSPYVAGHKHGLWVKRRHAPRVVKAVLLYAEAGLYTVGLWKAGALVPVGQATSSYGAAMDDWVRAHTVARFGPVREVEKTLIVAVTFDSVRTAPRRKAGVMLLGAEIVDVLPDTRADDLDALRVRV